MLLREKIKNGDKIVGTLAQVVRNPALMMLAKNADLDFVMYDCEHGSFNFEALHDAMLMGKALGVGGFVRVPVGTKDYVSRALDCGAIGVMVPMVETAGQAEDLVKYAKYPPVGRRGFATACAHTSYRGDVHAKVISDGNNQVITIAQIETKPAIENIDAIASVEGLDVLLVGPADLSISLGIPGDIMNPIELEAIGRVAAACKKHNIAFGMHGGRELLAKFAADISLLMSSMDTEFLASGLRGVRALADSL